MDEIIVGTYEGFLLGYSVLENDESKKLKATFATQSHTSSVRCISTAGKFLASGGTDDKVVIIDLRTRKEHTVLMSHDGTINTVAFTHNGTHLLSGSDDGTIIVTRTGNWQIEKIWKKAHGGSPVVAIAVHPSNKLALSIGGDKTLRTWNLIKGRPAFTINLASKGVPLATDLKFSPGGDRFSILSQQSVDIWTISKAGIEKRLTCNSKPACVQWVSDEKLFVGLENGHIISFTISDTKAQTYNAHKERVKCLHYDDSILYSASSSGELKTWSLSENKLTEVCKSKLGCRLTSIGLNKQSNLLKTENGKDKSEDPAPEENGNSGGEDDDDDNDEVEEIVQPTSQPGALVKVSYDDDESEQEVQPPKKQIKRRKRKNKNMKKQKLSKE